MTIYDQHDKAFNRVSAFAIMKGKNQVGTVAIKYPADGAGRLTCFLHIHCFPMVKGTASGYGYDKASAAFEQAINKQATVKLENWQNNENGEYNIYYNIAKKIIKQATSNQGADWQDWIKKAGYNLVRAI